VIVVTDLHGNTKMLNKVLAKFPLEENKYIILGDVIDRGPDSKECVEFARNVVSQGGHLIRGNHEQMMLEAIEQPSNARFWFTNGGYATLESYGLDEISFYQALNDEKPHDLLLDAHWIYVNSEDYRVDDRIMYTHAAPPLLNNEGKVQGEDHIWNRPEDGIHFPENADLVVMGHTPMERPVQQLVFQGPNGQKQNCLYLDAGVNYYGRIVAYDTAQKKAWIFHQDTDVVDEREIKWP